MWLCDNRHRHRNVCLDLFDDELPCRDQKEAMKLHKAEMGSRYLEVLG